MAPSAKKIILGLLLARQGEALLVREAVSACALFQITENNVRVALARLASEQMIESHGRGAYALGPAAHATAAEVTSWQQGESRLCAWHGDYICVSSAGSKALRGRPAKRRDWALHMLGMRELERGMWLRPNNLAGGAESLRDRLQSLSALGSSMVFVASDFDGQRQQCIDKLWDVQQLNSHYKSSREHLLAWLRRSEELDGETAARESYLLGGRAIRDLVFDPWLPDSMIDATARARYVQVVQQFDEAGKQIWQALNSFDSMMPVAEAASELTVGTVQ